MPKRIPVIVGHLTPGGLRLISWFLHTYPEPAMTWCKAMANADPDDWRGRLFVYEATHKPFRERE